MSVGLGPSVLNGRLRYLSVSQLEKFDSRVYGGCERKWWFRYVAGAKEKQKQAAKLGEQCHSQAEHYLRTGEDVLGAVLRPGKRFMPRPGPDLLVELSFGQLTEHRPGGIHGPVYSPLDAGGVPVIGKADLLHRREEWVDDDGVVHPDPGAAEVVDWKTTKTIADQVDPDTGAVSARGFAKTAEQLASTWQMVGYGELALRRWPDLQVVRLSHGYFQTQGRRDASKRSIAVPAREVRERWGRVSTLVDRMHVVADTKRVDDATPNYEACDAFGGCPFRSMCPRDPMRVLSSLTKGGNTMGLLSKMKERAAAGPAGPAGSPKPAPVVVAVSAGVSAEVERLKTEESAIRRGITPPDVPAPEKTAEPIPAESTVGYGQCPCGASLGPANASKLPDGGIKHIGCRSSAPEVRGEEGPGDPTPGEACSASGTSAELTTDEAVEKKRACACGVTLKLKPKKLGDGKWYALVPTHTVPAPAAPPTPEPPKDEKVAVFKGGEWKPMQPAPAAPATPASAPILKEGLWSDGTGKVIGPQAEGPQADGLALYLDCSEDGVVTRRLEAYVDDLCTELCNQFKLPDLRCAPDGAMAFGKWKGALAALARSKPPAPGAYSVSSGSEFGMVVFEALALTALRVVRGGR